MIPSISPLPGLDDALASIGLSCHALQNGSREVVLFGSRAAGLARAGSDWDVLCVGHGHTRRTRQIDLLWITPEELDSTAWLASELAGHIAHHGRWLAGEPSWTGKVTHDTHAPAQKRCWLVHRLAAWERSWPALSPRLRQHYACTLRQNLQRHEVLLQGRAVPPTPVLDETWQNRRHACDRHAALHTLARQAALDTAFVVRELIPLA